MPGPNDARLLRQMLKKLVFGTDTVPAWREGVGNELGLDLPVYRALDTPMEVLKIKLPPDTKVSASMVSHLLSSKDSQAMVNRVIRMPDRTEMTVHFFPLAPKEGLEAMSDPTKEAHLKMLNLSATKDAEDYLTNPAVMGPIGMALMKQRSPDQARFYDTANKFGLTGLIPGSDRVPGLNILSMLESMLGGASPESGGRIQMLKGMLSQPGQQTPMQGMMPQDMQNGVMKQQQKKMKTSLTDLLGYLSPQSSYQPPQDPSAMLPDTFPLARQTKVNWDPNYPAGVDESGEYDTQTNSIRMNPKSIQQNVKNPKGTGIETPYAPSGLAHEMGHALWVELARRMIDRDRTFHADTISDAQNALELWDRVHKENLVGNKSLGRYQYEGDPAHSFADAFGAFATNPVMLQRLFPDIYNYFQHLYTLKGPQYASQPNSNQ